MPQIVEIPTIVPVSQFLFLYFIIINIIIIYRNFRIFYKKIYKRIGKTVKKWVFGMRSLKCVEISMVLRIFKTGKKKIKTGQIPKLGKNIKLLYFKEK